MKEKVYICQMKSDSAEIRQIITYADRGRTLNEFATKMITMITTMWGLEPISETVSVRMMNDHAFDIFISGLDRSYHRTEHIHCECMSGDIPTTGLNLTLNSMREFKWIPGKTENQRWTIPLVNKNSIKC